jgi:hypothetical protein
MNRARVGHSILLRFKHSHAFPIFPNTRLHDERQFGTLNCFPEKLTVLTVGFEGGLGCAPSCAMFGEGNCVSCRETSPRDPRRPWRRIGRGPDGGSWGGRETRTEWILRLEAPGIGSKSLGGWSAGGYQSLQSRLSAARAESDDLDGVTGSTGTTELATLIA